jgi:hypothetical protein
MAFIVAGLIGTRGEVDHQRTMLRLRGLRILMPF